MFDAVAYRPAREARRPLLLTLGLLGAACSDDSDESSAPAAAVATTTASADTVAPADITAPAIDNDGCARHHRSAHDHWGAPDDHRGVGP